MKTSYLTSVLLVILLAPIIIFAQEDSTFMAPPKFDFDFRSFPGMTPKEEKALLKSLKKDLRNELKVIKEFNKNKYFGFLRESQFKNMNFPFIVKREKLIQQREREIFELEVKTEALAAKFEKANKNEKENIKRKLRERLNELFDIKEENRKQEVEELQQELEELKKSLKVRLNNKNEIINRRLQELLHEDKYLEWD